MAKPKRERALVGNASDPEQVKRATDVERARAERQINDRRAVMSTVEGRAECWRRLSDCGVFDGSMGADPQWTAYYVGRRSVGLKELADVMKHFPDLYLLMQSEAMKRDADEPRAPESEAITPETDTTNTAETEPQ